MNRWRDWWEQALRDFRQAGHSTDGGYHEWAAFAAQQAAEKSIKALILSCSGEPWGHSVTGLLEALPQGSETPESLMEAANRLDKHYLPARYPNGLPAGYPGKLYTAGEAKEAIADAAQIIEFCRGRLPG